VEYRSTDSEDASAGTGPTGGELVEATSGVVSPHVTARPIRVSGDVLAAADPAGALAGRFLLRHTRHTRAAYAGDLAEWFAFARRLGVDPLRAKVDHADAYALTLREQPTRSGRPLAPSTVQRKLSASPASTATPSRPGS
jgi:hypothetical protein